MDISNLVWPADTTKQGFASYESSAGIVVPGKCGVGRRPQHQLENQVWDGELAAGQHGADGQNTHRHMHRHTHTAPTVMGLPKWICKGLSFIRAAFHSFGSWQHDRHWHKTSSESQHVLWEFASRLSLSNMWWRSAVLAPRSLIIPCIALIGILAIDELHSQLVRGIEPRCMLYTVVQT